MKSRPDTKINTEQFLAELSSNFDQAVEAYFHRFDAHHERLEQSVCSTIDQGFKLIAEAVRSGLSEVADSVEKAERVPDNEGSN